MLGCGITSGVIHNALIRGDVLCCLILPCAILGSESGVVYIAATDVRCY